MGDYEPPATTLSDVDSEYNEKELKVFKPKQITKKGNQTWYEGQMLDDERVGWGRSVSQTGGIYEGFWKDDK